jgi:hypothetical protein
VKLHIEPLQAAHAATVAALVAATFTVWLIVSSLPACTPAERQTAVTDVTQFGAGACSAVDLVAAALGGADVPAIAALCGATEDAVIAALTAAGLPSDDAGAAQIQRASAVAATKAYRTAVARKGRR